MTPCIAIFDIGKTNKKCILFKLDFSILLEIETNLEPALDDDGEPCEDLTQLTQWLTSTWHKIEADLSLDVLALNFTAYGASLVHLNQDGAPVTPLYNYLKAFPEDLEAQFYATYGDKHTVAVQTASPPLGMLNSGLQLYWLKHRKPALFSQIKTTLHFPQYLSYLFSGIPVTDYTSLGCHTALWDFAKRDYHAWVYQEQLVDLFPPVTKHHQPQGTVKFRDRHIPVGLGLHDSSSATIPFLKKYEDPFLLLSTGTWGITLNPFSKKGLTPEELDQDCLHYLTFEGNPVKASRVFIGNTHEEWAVKLAAHFATAKSFFKSVQYDAALAPGQDPHHASHTATRLPIHLNLAEYENYAHAYHHLIAQIVDVQAGAIALAAEQEMAQFHHLVVDGGFSRNELFLKMLNQRFPKLHILVSQTAQGTALGAALLMNSVVRAGQDVVPDGRVSQKGR